MFRLIICSVAIFIFINPAVGQNYDEAKVPAYTLPAIFETASGREVKNRNSWDKIRRPEILKLFEDHIYGQMPTQMDSIRCNLLSEDKQAMGGAATLKEVAILVYKNRKSVQINLTLFVPNNPKNGKPGVLLLINNRPKSNTDPTRQKKSEFWPAEMVIDSGLAIAAFHVGDLAPDDRDQYVNGVLRLYPEQLKEGNGMKAIGAWAWGASRVMDYLEQEPRINSRKVVVVGHSRGGKTSLWAAAQDRRFAACVSNCSGNTGAALARRQFGERISRINETFPHWFADNYKQYNDRENDLPVDQHMLIALIAPRPVYITNASKDLWADPTGSFLAAKQAEKVYALFGKKSQLPAAPPAIDKAYPNPPLAYHNREGEHNMTHFDWGNFIIFANQLD